MATSTTAPSASSGGSGKRSKKGVDHECEAYRKMWDDWQLIKSLSGGTRAMRMMCGTYMPKRPLEEDADYKDRVSNSTLVPVFIETAKAMVGRIFSQDPVLKDNAPDWLKKDIIPNIDRQGRNLQVFMREWALEGMEYGVTHLLVDSPEAPAGTDPAQITEDDRVKYNIRPYIIRVHAENVLGWREKGGQLVQLRCATSEMEPDGDWGYRIVEAVRVYTLIEAVDPKDNKVQVQVFKRTTNSGDSAEQVPGDSSYQPDGSPRVIDIPRIPLVSYYTDRTGYLTARPPLREVAFLNAKHWRIKSYLDVLLDVASVPILTTTGVDTNDTIVIGAKSVVKLPANADMKYVEHNGNAIGALQAELKNLLEEMRQAGASILKPLDKRTGRTSTEVNDEDAREASPLGHMVKSFEDSIAMLFDTMALFYKDEANTDGVSGITCRPNLNPDNDPGRSVDNLMKLCVGGVLSRQTVFETARNNGVFDNEIEWEDEQARIIADGVAVLPEDTPVDEASVVPPDGKDKPPPKPTVPARGNKTRPTPVRNPRSN